MSSHALFNLRTKRNLEINELTDLLNKKYGTHYEPHQLWEWENHQHEPEFKDAMNLADFFDAPYELFVESKYQECQQQLEDVDIRL
ncbi:transcriptional regulator [Staphylococcus lugdunensis]|uniref:transcriptional regulator n=1 Tax=Staphylococcus lugdunensis TaxID=28035 RepID=UPI0009B703A2|nr:transcriptional regulator [Staphylococcus lugdunensis]ARB78680.1 transcriptional regulator [Staphylococcus lugdunensis]PNZ63655.1 transcriptional regulator [Staphylococcus lugdunensis]SQI97153.1 XRE family transcription regulator, putative [Staphylococcus lugdunensis]